jgi:hypothetical protein
MPPMGKPKSLLFTAYMVRWGAGNRFRAWCFPFFQLVDGSIDFSKTDGIVDHHHAWFLFEEVDRSQTIIRQIIQLAKQFN